MNDDATSFSGPPVFVGIDVSKKTLDACLLAGTSKQLLSFDNTVGGIASLVDRLRRAHPAAVRLVVLEATGRYERRCGVELMSHGFEVAIVDPRQPRDYARCQNLLAKTDAIDAFVLASFARVIGPRAPASSPRQTSCCWTRW
jgi:transposase